MGQIIYNITAGVPDFYVSILPEEAPMQTHASTGLYSFDNIPDGIYSLTVVDSVGCEQVFNNIEIINSTAIKYGYLYNWYAATDIRKISSSDDWVVPSLTQWQTLIDYVGGANIAGGKLKETGLTYWNSPNTGASNEFGFNARGAGQRYIDGLFSNSLKELCGYWTTTIYSGNNINQMGILKGEQYLGTFFNDKKIGSSLILLYVGSGSPTSYIGNDGKVYPVVIIGGQRWINCNLGETKFRNGDWISGYNGGVYTPISNEAWSALTTEAMCAYNDDESNVLI